MDRPHSRNRRSHPSLTHLSITPIHTTYPLPATTAPLTPTQTSYITPKSLPQSPSLLSRSPSLPQPSRSSHALNDLARASTPLHPSKSTSQLARAGKDPAKGRKSRRESDHDNESWLLQTASLLTTATAESKGQAWLATRSSSTSLENYGYALESAYKADDEFSPTSVRYPSRTGSRPTSARGSRKGSRVGLVTPNGVRTPGEEEGSRGDYFGAGVEGVDGVDFVEDGELEWEDGDDGEMRRLVWGRVGGWVDWAVGWMDWRVDEEAGLEGEEMEEEKADEDEGTEVKGAGKEKRRRRRRRRREEGGRIVVNRVEDVGRLEVPPPAGDGGWKDAKWLLGVAGKILV